MLIADWHEGFSIKLLFNANRLFVYHCLRFYLCPLSVFVCIFSSLLLLLILRPTPHTHLSLIPHSSKFFSLLHGVFLFNLPLSVKISLLLLGLRISLNSKESSFSFFFFGLYQVLSHTIVLYASFSSNIIAFSEWAHSYP